MWQIIPKRGPKSDPAPSRWSYRFMRIMLSPVLRRLVVYGVPTAVVAAGVGLYFSDLERRDQVTSVVYDLYRSVLERPEFMVNVVSIQGASTALDADIRDALPFEFPISQFDLEIADLRDLILEMDPVKSATIQVRSGGILQIDVAERQPALIWRTQNNLDVLDETGAFIRPAMARADYPELPLIAGAGANFHTKQAIALLKSAAPVQDRLRGLVYVGERRWDVVIDQGPRILLPDTNPVQVLERVLVMHQAQDVLDRDIAVLDFRLPQRPTLRLNQSNTTEVLTSTQASSE